MARRILVVAAVAAAAVSTAVVGQAAVSRATPAQRAQARAIVNASMPHARRVDAVVARVASCPAVGDDAVAEIERLPMEQAQFTVTRVVEVLSADFLQEARPAMQDWAAALGRLRTKDRILRAGIAGFRTQVQIVLAAAPVDDVDSCGLLTSWRSAGWPQEAAPTGIDLAALEANAQLRSAGAAVTRMKNRLIAFGISRRVASSLFG